MRGIFNGSLTWARSEIERERERGRDDGESAEDGEEERCHGWGGVDIGVPGNRLCIRVNMRC